LPMIAPNDEHNWQRYNIRLSDKALAELLSRLEIETTGFWSFKLASPRCDNYPVYTFFFAQTNDVSIALSFELGRSFAE
jgi:hypothetical protein